MLRECLQYQSASLDIYRLMVRGNRLNVENLNGIPFSLHVLSEYSRTAASKDEVLICIFKDDLQSMYSLIFWLLLTT